MEYEFNHRSVLLELANCIEDILGNRLPFIDDAETMRAVIIGVDGVQPHLPYINVIYNGSSDSDGWSIATGTTEVTVEDPDNPLATITYETSYTDTIVNFMVSIVAVSDPTITTALNNYDTTNASQLLRKVRGNLLLPKYRNRLRDNVSTVIQFGNNQIISTPDVFAGQTRERFTLRLPMTSIDRVIDYDDGLINQVNWTGTLNQIDDTDPTPIIVTGTTGIIYQP